MYRCSSRRFLEFGPNAPFWKAQESAAMVAKALNPMDAYRREQKKKARAAWL